MVEALGANRMMPGLDMFASGQTFWGVKIAGFHCPSLKFQEQLDRLKSAIPNIAVVSSLEQDGYMSFIAAESLMGSGPAQLYCFRREVHVFFRDLPKSISGLKAREISQMILAGSSGSLFLTLLYRE